MIELSQFRPLTQVEREQAKNSARNSVIASIGSAPSPAAFMHNTYSIYPNSIRWTIYALCIIVLIAAFLPSAIRLHASALDALSTTITDTPSRYTAARAFVVLAELTQIIATMAMAVTRKDMHRMLVATALMATAIALFGNLYSMNINIGNGFAKAVFTLLETVSPPLIVLAMSHVLKSMFLNSISERHTGKMKYQQALDQWTIESQRPPTEHPRWMEFYALALRDKLLSVYRRGSQRDVVVALTDQEWRILVMREVQAEQWWADTPAVEEKKSAPRSLPTGNNTGEVVLAIEKAVQNAEELWETECPRCQRVFQNKEKTGLRGALTAHIRHQHSKT